MPDLPTITVTDVQQTRILAALKDHFGTGTPQETAAAYKRWLAGMIKDIVYRYESAPIEQQKTELRDQIQNNLIDPL